MLRIIPLAAFVGWLSLFGPAIAQPLPPTTIPAPASAPALESIPRQTLETMYRRELGELYNPAQADSFYDTHQLIEKYFAAPAAADRKALVKEIDAIGLDPNIVGRLTRLHMDWQALEPGVYYINDKIGPNEVHYFLGVPKNYDRTQPWPLVIKLPNAGELVTKPMPDADEVVKIYDGWMNDELTHHPDALALMPLVNIDEGYGPSYPGMNSVIQAMQHAATRVNVDPTRVYMVGHSMSAHAVWNLALHYPTYFAAINPLAGLASADWQRLRAMNLRNVLAVVWHDADDQLIKVTRARDLVKVLQSYKCDVDYEETKNVGHVPSQAILDEEYAKMRARTRELYPRAVALRSNRPDAMFNRNDWVQVYQMLRPGDDRKLFFRHGSGSMTVSQNTYALEAFLTGPTKMDVKSDNVESMRFYFNDQMIDFSKPFTIVVNGKTRFEGLIKPSVEEMLKDQVFLGRGWRYFTGIVDIDFGEIVPYPTLTTKPTTRPATVPIPH
jgi:pimeloyl-ACP methyl ester carboxylesterase